MFELKGMLSLHAGNRQVAGQDRIELLAAIGESGSISAAARAVGMSYKGAWDAVDAMNNLADEPLVVRAAGGHRGGGTTLTPRGQRLVEAFRVVAAEHARYVARLGALDEASSRDLQLMRRFALRTSARNQLAGTVVALEPGEVNDLVGLRLPGGQTLQVTITRASTEELALTVGAEAIALIKAPAVTLVPADDDAVDGNRLDGFVVAIHRDAADAEVRLELDGGGVLIAVVPQERIDALQLAEGRPARAVIDASSVLLGTTG
ncbi:TOBE domain-containing protein [Dyella lutea]|uniref:TOBE domain-containing protein n=1 Tax=Dyella lutea TaxID=2950441 RepID=A0ABT1FD31_9GAMM|nr:TOBE domain-containing protein [Dyella lutea]MCP1375285.1 TOBE domain-containing protein [Dyella lutea]